MKLLTLIRHWLGLYPWLRAESVQTALLLTDFEDFDLTVIASWTYAQRWDVFRWAMTEHFRASDNDDMPRVPRPAFLPFPPPKDWTRTH